MWSLEALHEINQLAAKLARKGKPEFDALFIFLGKVHWCYDNKAILNFLARMGCGPTKDDKSTVTMPKNAQFVPHRRQNA